jgi:hypothetical protein
MRTYSFSYRHNGKDWSLNYFADNEEDAKRKLQSIKSNADFDGEVVVSASIPFISRLFAILKKASEK